jgi:hypothetical protein
MKLLAPIFHYRTRQYGIATLTWGEYGHDHSYLVERRCFTTGTEVRVDGGLTLG